MAATTAAHTKHIALPQKMIKLILQRCLCPDAIAMILMVRMAGSMKAESGGMAIGSQVST
jgi:hypothetical protein